VKLANPELDVWIVTGDGDSLSIGGNHMLHLLRRNLDCQVLLFNNEIYGLTKGQYSPTSRSGTQSPSTPLGSVERPINPCAFALGAGARFIARSYDIAQAKTPAVLRRAYEHKGASFVELYQNCIVYNDGAFDQFASKKAGPDALLWLDHGQPMVFAKGTKGLRLNRQSLALEVVPVVDGNIEGLDILVHDETNKTIAQLLVAMPFGGFPVALGVIFCDPAAAFDHSITEQNKKAASVKKRDLNALLRKGETWEVDGGRPITSADAYPG
jgi:2-oxoglutarate ferredoxin oxidoreductase subunit beta